MPPGASVGVSFSRGCQVRLGLGHCKGLLSGEGCPGALGAGVSMAAEAGAVSVASKAVVWLGPLRSALQESARSCSRNSGGWAGLWNVGMPCSITDQMNCSNLFYSNYLVLKSPPKK